MKINVTIFIAGLTIAGFAAVGFVDEAPQDSIENDNTETVNTLELTDFGINGGLTINSQNGSVSQFVSGNILDDVELFYSVRGWTKVGYNRAITQQKLRNANAISDVIEGYPSSWIAGYNSVTISVTVGNKEMEEVSMDEVLTTKQKEILDSAEVSSSVLITVQYIKQNYNDKVENRQMNALMTVVPATEAKYVGGRDKMIAYLKDNSIDQIKDKKLDYLPQPTLSFVVNEAGVTEEVKLVKTSNNKDIDQLLIDLVKEMPQWEPAKNADDLPVKQQFILDIGQGGC